MQQAPYPPSPVRVLGRRPKRTSGADRREQQGKFSVPGSEADVSESDRYQH
jgi:hypothetical protein